MLYAVVALLFLSWLALYAADRKRARWMAEFERRALEKEERLKAEMELVRGEQNRLLAVLEGMVEGVLVVDAGQRIMMVNSRLARVLHFARRELEGRYFWEVLRDPKLNGLIEESLKNQSIVKTEHSILLSEAVFEIQISPVFKESLFLGVVVVLHDITRIKNLERMRSEFVANVSHELKTPMTSIMGYVETLKEGGMDDKVHRLKFLGVIEEHSKKLCDLIDELLVLSRLESDRQELKREELDLKQLFLKILGYEEPRVRSRGIRVVKEFPEADVKIFGEEKLLEQALTNLIDNAIKYNREGGEIRLVIIQTPLEVRIEIQDTGLGIPERDIPRVFERFYRVEKSRSRDTGGTGLGLAITKHVIERHGGRIQLKSELEKGSTFTLTLPVI